MNFTVQSEAINIRPGQLGWKSQETALAGLGIKEFEIKMHRTAGKTDGECSCKVTGSQSPTLHWGGALSIPLSSSSPAEDSDLLPLHTQCGSPNGDLPLGVHTTSSFKQWSPSKSRKGMSLVSIPGLSKDWRQGHVPFFIPAVTGLSLSGGLRVWKK